jgi:RNA polymerase sigma factor for flagellar operon FliA
MTAPTPLTSEQQALVRAHLHLVEPIARRLAAKLGRRMSFEELCAWGREGLVEAARRFDAELNPNFSDFAPFRMKGAMIDAIKREVSHEKWVILAAQKTAFEAMSEIRRTGNPLTDTDEILRERLESTCDFAFGSMFAALAGALARAEGEAGVVLREQYERALYALSEAMASFTPGERRLLELRYNEDKTYDDIAAELKMTFKTVRTAHEAAVQKLGKRLRSRGVRAMPELEGRPELRGP